MLTQPDYPLNHLVNRSLRLRGHHAQPLQGLMLHFRADEVVFSPSTHFQKVEMHYFDVDEPPRHSSELLGLLPVSQVTADSVRHIFIAEQPDGSSELYETLEYLVGCDCRRHYCLFSIQMCHFHHPYTYVVDLSESIHLRLCWAYCQDAVEWPSKTYCLSSKLSGYWKSHYCRSDYDCLSDLLMCFV